MELDKKVIKYYASFYDVSKELDEEQFYEFNMVFVVEIRFKVECYIESEDDRAGPFFGQKDDENHFGYYTNIEDAYQVVDILNQNVIYDQNSFITFI